MIEIQRSIIALAGLPLTGKTAIGKELAREYNIPFFDIDATRQEIAPGNEWLGPDREREVMLASYQRNHEKAGKALDLGKAVVMAATYSRKSYHNMLRDLALDHGVPLKVMLLQIPDDVVISRLRERIVQGSSSNITNMESYAEVRDRYKPFEGDEITIVDTSQPIRATLDVIAPLLTDNL